MLLGSLNKYRERDLIQLTGKSPHRKYMDDYNRRFLDTPKDFIAYPDWVDQYKPKESVFFKVKKLLVIGFQKVQL